MIAGDGELFQLRAVGSYNIENQQIHIFGLNAWQYGIALLLYKT